MPASRLNHQSLTVMREYTLTQACPWVVRSESAGDLEGSWCILVVCAARLQHRKFSSSINKNALIFFVRITTSNSSTVFITNVLSAVSRFSLDQSRTTPSVSVPSALSLKLLQHHLTHTIISRDDSGIPLAHPTTLSSSSTPHSSPPAWNYAPAPSPDPLNFASFVPLFASTDALAPMFRLGSALFDPIDLHLNRSRAETSTTDQTSITPDIRNRVQLLRRKKALSNWLGEVVKPSVDSDLRTQANGSNGDNPSLIRLNKSSNYHPSL
jgi:hypothetical protein